jgi:orotidine-5'-phosphate decarboxylase
VQIAYYEEMGIAGLQCYADTLKYLRGKKALVIADIKRGDIADTARRYAKAHFEGDFEADFVTLSPYMGMDSIEPWLEWAERGKGAFVLMRTSNKGMKDFEYLTIDTIDTTGTVGTTDTTNRGETGYRNRRLYDVVGEKLSQLAGAHSGVSGYGVFGAVVGCTEREEAAKIRERYPHLFFLIPGYGVQGGAADDAALLLKGGNGGVVNASRSILKAWSAVPEGPEKQQADLAFAAEAAGKAAFQMRDAIRAACAG